MSEKEKTKTVAPPFEVNLFRWPILPRSRAVALAITIKDDDGSLWVDKGLAEFYPWRDIVQITIRIKQQDRLVVLSRVGHGDFRVKEPIGDAPPLCNVTFVPDASLGESYIPHPHSGMVIAEIVDAYVLRLWKVHLVTSRGVTRLEVTHKDIARPGGLVGGDSDGGIIQKFAKQNTHLFS